MRAGPHLSLSLLATGLCFLAACGGEGESGSSGASDGTLDLGAPLASVRDSGGVEIVEIDLEQARRVVRTRSEPRWSVGAGGDDDGEQPALHRVVDAVFLDDGTVAIAEASTQEIVLADPETGSHRRIGGEGDGPAEFRGLSRLHPEGPDRIGAWDADRLRYAVLTLDGELVSERSAPRIDVGRAGRRFFSLADGRFILFHLSTFPDEPAPRGRRGRAPVVLVDGERIDTLDMVPGRATFRGERGMGAVPFGATSEVELADDGLWIGDTDARAVEKWGLDGELRRIVRWRFERSRELTPARIDSFVEAAVSTAPEAARPRAREMARSFPFPDREPAFGSLLVDEADRLWIGEFVDPEVEMLQSEPWPARQWLVVDDRGRPLGMATTPAGLEATRIGRDWVLGVHRDSLGVETVRLHDMGVR